ncbi:MAG: putative polysaccharide deacetylase [Frankiales bacterium]|nr:putative polysaccharide deacetylase [Frankiales bacterium]
MSPHFATALPGPRAWLRARPQLQGSLVAPAGARHRLPHRRGGLHVVLYHDVAGRYERNLLAHLDALLDRGRFLSWPEALIALAGPAPLEVPTFSVTFDDGHKEWAQSVLQLLQERNLPATFFVTTDKVVTGDSQTQLTWADCAALVAAGMRIGSHSVTHRRLIELSDAEARSEVVASKDELEQRLGICVEDFSIPYGLPGSDFGERELGLIADAGYLSSVTALPGRNLAGQSRYQVRRCGLNPAWPLTAVKQRVHE